MTAWMEWLRVGVLTGLRLVPWLVHKQDHFSCTSEAHTGWPPAGMLSGSHSVEWNTNTIEVAIHYGGYGIVRFSHEEERSLPPRSNTAHNL